MPANRYGADKVWAWLCLLASLSLVGSIVILH